MFINKGQGLAISIHMFEETTMLLMAYFKTYIYTQPDYYFEVHPLPSNYIVLYQV